MGIVLLAYVTGTIVVAFSIREVGSRVLGHLRHRRVRSLEPIVLDFTAYNLKKRR